MTAGFGGYQAGSQEVRGLKTIDSTKVSYANKDFVKNMQRLNQATDYISSYMQTMQKGIDDANKNVIEEIQGFAADLFVLFAGLEPTGIEIGDLKYVIQGLGALFGISPDTPFPLNLAEAAYHFFGEYIIPLPQFSDVVFDAIEAWAEELGFSEDFIEAFSHFRESVENLFGSLDIFIDKINELFDALGIVGLDLESFADTFALVIEIVTSLLDNPLVGNVIEFVTDVLAPLVDTVATLIDLLNPGNLISGGQVTDLGANIVPKPNAITTIWSVGSNANTGWIFDNTQAPTGTPSAANGSFKTNGNGTAKRIVTQKITTCKPKQKLVCNGKMKWAGIPGSTTDLGMCIVWYQGNTEVSQTNIDLPNTHGATGGFSGLPATTITVPSTPDIDGFRVGARIGTGVNTGTVNIGDLSVQIQGKVGMGIVEGLTDIIGAFSDGDLLNLDGILNFASIFDSIDFLDGAFNPIDAFVDFLLGFNIFGGFSTILGPFEQFFNLLGGIPFVGGFVQSIAASFNQTQQVAQQASVNVAVTQQKITSIETIFALDSSRPLWEGIDGSAESSVPYALLNNGYVVNSSTARGAFIRCAGGVEKRTIAMALNKSGTVTTCNYDLYKLQEDNSVSLVLSSDNITTDISTSSFTLVPYTIPDEANVVPELGDIYLIQIRMTGGGQVNVSGCNLPDILPLSGFKPLKIGLSRNPTTPAPATIASATLDSLTSLNTPYIEFGSVPQDYARQFYDNFDRDVL